MRLNFDAGSTRLRSPSQSARVWTEQWVSKWTYCPNCGRSKIEKYENNRPVADFFCGSCKEEYELKSQKDRFGSKVLDGAFHSMCRRLTESNNPNLMLLTYEVKQFSVTNLFVVPKHFFVRDIIEERKPLAATARRAGWIGCNILLSQIPDAGKIFFIRNGKILPKKGVLTKWRKTLFLRNAGVENRGWLIEVMKCIELIGRPEFNIADLYAFEERLRGIYPNNNYVKPKIRQQLQVLRDQEYLDFVSRGNYRLRSPG